MKLRLIVFALLSLLASVYVWSELRVRTSIVDFLPDDEHSQLLRIARDLSAAPQSRIAVFTVTASAPEQHREAARALQRKLLASGAVHWVRGGLDASDQQLFYKQFFAARLGLVDLPGQGVVPDDVLTQRVQQLRERLSSPLGALTRELAPADPLGMFEQFVSALSRTQGELQMVDGQLTTLDGRWSVLFADVKAPPFDGSAQRAFGQLVQRLLNELRPKHSGLTLEWTSVGRFAQAAEQSIREDITRISVFSTLGILLLYLWVFRSVREPLLVMLPIAFGSVLSLAVCQLLFGFVHGLSLAFGTSIIGVAEDFSTHYFTHRREASAEEGNEPLMRRLWPAMLLGGITTALGVLSLSFSGFPGLAQMAVFGALGVLGALFCTRYVLPPLTRLPRKPYVPSRARTATLRTIAERRWLVAVLVGLPALLLVVGVPRLRFQDGVAALRTRTPLLDAENERVQARLGRSGGAGRVVVALGENDEQALRVAEQVRARLDALPATSSKGHRSVVDLLPSEATQRKRSARLREDSSLRARLTDVLHAQGFVPEAFEEFFASLSKPQPTVTAAALRASALGSLIAPLRAEITGQVAYLTPISTDRPHVVADALKGLPNAFFLDQEALYAEAYGRFRERALTLSLWGMGLVFIALWLRYRSFHKSLLGTLPALLGGGGALGLLGILGVPVSFLNVIALLLVLSMGEDYGVYALETQDDQEAATTLGSVVLAATTSVLSFGLLALSDNPALRAIGITVGAGLFFCVLTSPVVLVLARRSR